MRFLLAALLLGLSINAHSNEIASADDWLRLSSDAMQTLQYQGVLVYSAEGRMDSMQYTRLMTDAGLREHLVSLTGSAREVLRVANKISSKVSGQDESSENQVTSVLTTFNPAQIVAASGHYKLSLAGTSRIAGLEVQIIEAKPVDAGRYGYRLSVAKQSGMLLGSALLDSDQNIIEQFIFASFALIGNQTPIDASRWPKPAIENPPPSDFHPVGLPAGFELVAVRGVKDSERKQFVFSDGMANVSVYLEPNSSSAAAFIGHAKRGAIHVFGRVSQQTRITVLGDLPAETVERIAQSVELPEPNLHTKQTQ